MYDPSMVQPMRDEITRVGVKELLTAQDVDEAVKSDNKSTLIFINSVCGCAAGMARPGLTQALQHSTLPNIKATAFAGMEKDAVAKARDHMVGYPPSSPSFGLFRDGEVVHVIQRHEIEGHSASDVAQILTSAFDKYCGETVRDDVEIYDPKKASEISPKEAAELLKAGARLIDVREPFEVEKASIVGSILLTEEIVVEAQEKWPKDAELVIYCHHGIRSLDGVAFFKKLGFSKARSLTGGIQAWSLEIDSAIPQY